MLLAIRQGFKLAQGSKSAFAFGVMVLGLLLLASCSPSRKSVLVGGATMGTSWSVKLVAAPVPATAALSAMIQAELDTVEASMSNWRDDSDVSRFNAMAAGCMAVSEHTLTVVQAALTLSQLSQGKFDMTLGPLIELWGFGKRIGTDDVPTPAKLAAAKAKVDYQAVYIEAAQLCKNRDDSQINLSAIAKGYGVDVVAQRLAAAGYKDFLVEVGGELYGQGLSAKNKPWAIGIEKPTAGNREAMAQVAIPLQAQGIATSGDYRNFFEQDGRRYSHLLDPVTGQPVQHQVASVTVLASSSMLADGWATAIHVMGAEDGIALANQQGLAALVISYSDAGLVTASSQLWRD